MKMIGRYEILGTLGSGAMGDVFKGRDPSLDRIVAVKVIRDVVSSAKALERFQREARAAARLNHPNIITVHEFGDHEGHPFIAMEYLEGKDLEDLLEETPDLPVEKQIDILRQAALGLHFAHQKDIIHRDVKPANIAVLNDGTVKIMDFGIAKLGDTKLTQTGSVMGTVRYMPPEQIQGMDLDGRADLFSLGVTAYEMITKQRAFGGDSMTNVIYNVMHVEPEPITTLDGTPHAWLQSVIHACLEKDRENRWPDCQSLVDALDRKQPVRPGDLTGARKAAGKGAARPRPAQSEPAGHEDATQEFGRRRPTTPAESSRRSGGGGRGWLAAAGAVVLLMATVGGWILFGGSSERATLMAQAETARAEARHGDARDLLLQAQSAEGTDEELADSRARFASLQEPLRTGGDPLAAKAVLDQVVAWSGATAETRAAYQMLGRSLAEQGLPQQGPPFVAALQQSVSAYQAARGDPYDSAKDYSLMSSCFELGNELVARADEQGAPPHAREAIYDLARKLFLFVDEYEPGFNAFELANHARLERARLAGIVRALDLFKGEVDGLIAEAEQLEADPQTHVQAIGNYRVVLSRVAENPELKEHVALESYRTLAESAIARLEGNRRDARQQMSRDKQTASLAAEASGLEQQGDLRGALANYEELLGIEPGHANAQARVLELRATLTQLDGLKRAIEYTLSKKDLSTAHQKLDEALALTPADADLAAFGARLQRLEKSSREASEGAALLAKAARLREQGEPEEAERRYLDIAASTNDNSVRRQADEAVREIRVARQRAEIQPLADEAKRLERQGDIAGALASWRQVERLNSAWPGVKGHVRRLRRLESKAEIDATAFDLQRVLNSQSPDPKALKRLQAKLARLDPGHALVVHATQERESHQVAAQAARAAIDRLDPDAAQAARAGLDGVQQTGLAEVREAAGELAGRRDDARAKLAASRSALASGRPGEASGLAEQAALLWPPLRASADDLLAQSRAAIAAATAVTSAPPQAAAPTNGPEQAIQSRLSSYTAAVRSADLNALKRSWPSLKGKQLKGIKEGFNFAKSHDVVLNIRSLEVDGQTAVVICDREDRLVTRDGQVIENSSLATFRLRAAGSDWLIDAIR